MKITRRIVVPVRDKNTGRMVDGAFVPPTYTNTHFDVTVEVDIEALIFDVGQKASLNRTGKSKAMAGIVKATSRRTFNRGAA